MVILGLSFLHVVETYKIYTKFVSWQFFQNDLLFYLTLYIDLYHLLTSLSDGVLFIHYDSCRVYTIISDAPPLLNTLQERKKYACFT